VQAAIAARKSVDDAAAGINLTNKYKDYKLDRVKAAV
jgi:hypothetical protein